MIWSGPGRITGVLVCLCRSRSSAGGVRGCPRVRPRELPRTRTYNGQRCRAEWHATSFMQVNGHVEWQLGAVCKTVGSAYVGSNPTPATRCENPPLAAISRAGGGFLPCPVVCHLVTLWTVMLRCPRTYSGRPSVRLGRSVCAATTVAVRSYDGRCAQLPRSVRTVGCFTDGHGRAAPAAGSGWTSAARAVS